MENSTTLEVDAEVGSAKQLLNEGRITAAIAKLQGVLQQVPKQQEALYALAVCYRYNAKFYGTKLQDALATLDELLKRYPKYARGYQERGHLYRDLNKPIEAIKAYEQAIALNPALPSSWKNLSALYKSRGSSQRARACDEQVESLAKLPEELLSVTSMIHEGKLYLAEKLCRSFMQKNRRNVEGMRLLAKLGTELDILDDADFLLESALKFAPGFRAARYDYAQVLYKRQRFQKSLEQADLLLEMEPDNSAYQLVCANAAAAVGEFDRALALYDQLIALYSDSVQLYILKGHALKSLGEPQRAIEAYREATKIKPDHGDAYWSLANIKTYRFEEAEIAQMQRAEADAATGNVNRYQLCFALGKSFEDCNDYERAFNYYARGNQLKLAESGYRAERTDDEFARQKAICNQQFFRERTGYGVYSSEPIFIVGLPRAGSTLLEQILASHPMVDGTIELPNIISLAQMLGGRHKIDEESQYPEILETLDREQFEHFGNDYLESTRVYRQGASFFTDKTPNNFRHIGLIHLIFPNAKIIDARRHPMACCFSNFKQLFGKGQDFSYGLEEIGRYYCGYVALMDHWERVLPGKILRVQYEEIVDDVESRVRRLLDFLGLPFDQRCIEFYKNERAVHTPSAEQVRQPIYHESIEQWKNFEPFLGPLKESLGIA
ncbi:MAG: sulfotransferase [Gammaproteobacteria bacterium]